MLVALLTNITYDVYLEVSKQLVHTSKQVCVPESEQHSHLVGWRVPQECSHTARAESLRRPRPRSTHITHRHSGRHSFSIIIIIISCSF